MRRSNHKLGEDRATPSQVDEDGNMAERRYGGRQSLLLSQQTRYQQANLPFASTVYTPEDVELAISHGVDGIIISNHGGRQLDGVASSLDALRECADAARGKIQIAMDGGIRRGSDVFKALALGAKFCFFGRPVVWGLAVRTVVPYLRRITLSCMDP